jgi:hypothetical protein
MYQVTTFPFGPWLMRANLLMPCPHSNDMHGINPLIYQETFKLLVITICIVDCLAQLCCHLGGGRRVCHTIRCVVLYRSCALQSHSNCRILVSKQFIIPLPTWANYGLCFVLYGDYKARLHLCVILCPLLKWEHTLMCYVVMQTHVFHLAT